jgi:hypothetical protein
MPPYATRNPSGIFQIFNGDNKDKTTRIMQAIGIVAFLLALIAAIFGGAFNKTISAHKSLEIIVGVCGGGGFFVGVFMFIGVGARITGQQSGVNSFAGQILRVLWRTFLFLLLPILILTLLLLLFIHPKR